MAPTPGRGAGDALPAGIYEELVTGAVKRALTLVPADQVELGRLEPADAHDPLAQYLGRLAARVLRSVGGIDDQARLAEQQRRINRVIAELVDLAPEILTQEELVEEMRLLLAIRPPATGSGPRPAAVRPEVPLSRSALLVNGRDQPRIGSEVNRELSSADEVDLICAFVKWTGLRIVERSIGDLIVRGGRVRVLTTAYMGATDRRAVDRLVQLGASVRISYDVRTTRLHAKAWLFRRRSGADTAYVGSSNLSKVALVDGMEWNVRLSAMEQPHVLEAFEATFDDYWEDSGFEAYDPGRDRDRLDLTLAAERGAGENDGEELLSLRLTPFPYQREVLDQLEAERTIHERWQNLVVMATGTGKTVVSALDYERLRSARQVESLLFVAHREELLRQSRSTFRAALRDGAFGEILIGGEVPEDWRHVFASVQSLSRASRLEALSPDAFDMIVVDEFHHSEADTYTRLLGHFRPRVLLGLTATPERTDGQDVTHWFGGRIAVELRLWEALDRGLLAPFQYFGIHDDVDVSHVPWRRGAYDLGALSNIYTGHDARARMVAQAFSDKVSDIGSARALGFCVSIDHAEFMARRFKDWGIPADAISARSRREDRQSALRRLREREINALFAVDLFNEGIDVPEIDTVLFLRPTESATVFLQQLGRGLRLAGDKACLTVLDFVGNQNANFRFDRRYRALTGVSRRDLEEQVAAGFPYLPAGCHIDLDREVGRLVLANVSRSLRLPWRDLVRELASLGDVSLEEFLVQTGLDPEDLYRTFRGGWAGLRREAGLPTAPPGVNDAPVGRSLGRMLHLDDMGRLDRYRAVLRSPEPPVLPAASRGLRELAMLHFLIWGRDRSLEEFRHGMSELWAEPARRRELLEVLDILAARLERVTVDLPEGLGVPLSVHAHYAAREAAAAFGDFNLRSFYGQGVRWIESAQADLLFVDLRKTEKHYSPTTMYNDRAVTPELFQWESQSTTSERSPTGQRYLNHVARGSCVHLFIRESKTPEGAGLGAPPFLYAGPCRYVSHVEDRPLRITWRLEYSLPPELFSRARVIAG